jgi:hypothetical protein
MYDYFNKIIILWLLNIIPQIVSSYHNNNKFYNIGINNNLIFYGYNVDNYYIYSVIIIYIIINRIIRITISNILANSKNKKSINKIIISSFYTWYDWYLNINLLLTQIDLFLYDIFTDVISNVIIKYYLIKNNNIQLEEIICWQ